MLYYCILCGIIILLIIAVTNKNIEYFITYDDNVKMQSIKEIDMDLLDKITFGDIIRYDNDDDGRLGLDKCYDNKHGHCVEYGVSGIAYYYPPEKANTNYGNVINFEAKDNENTDEFKYPAFR